MAVCPFHNDKNPIMKIDNRYYCFGCGEKGDAIDFVAKFYGLGKKDAALQIVSEFGISFDDNRCRKPPPKRKRKLSPEQRFERVEKKCFRVLSDYLCQLREWQEQYSPHEAEGIFLWCLKGLHCLIDNGYRFTIGKRAEDNLTKTMQDGNNIIVFMQSEGYIRLEKGTHATSKQLYGAYSQWCEDNLEKPLGERSFANFCWIVGIGDLENIHYSRVSNAPMNL